MQATSNSAHYLAEWYLPELTEESVDAMVAKLDVAADSISGTGSHVRLLVTLAVPTDEVLYGVFRAHSSDTVRMTCRRAGVPPHRLTSHVGTRISRQDQVEPTAG